ncbi:MAG: hypothetical protein AAFN93_22275 [Bacteroidota bacterium]
MIDIQSPSQGRIRQVLQLSPEQREKVKLEKDAILASLGEDKSISISAITEILKDMLNG